MRRFYVPAECFPSETIKLNLEETRHLRDVLRLRETAQVQIFDGGGREFLCTVQTIGKKETVLKVLEQITPTAPESNLNLTLAVALLKGEKFDLVVQKAVELGVTELVPLNTIRTDVKIKDSEKRAERWRKIALEACKQSGRARLMRVGDSVDLKKFTETADGVKILFAERGGTSLSAIEKTKNLTAIIGAEGGWEASEIEAAREKGFQIVTLQGRILRAETAAIAITAILQHRFGDLI